MFSFLPGCRVKAVHLWLQQHRSVLAKTTPHCRRRRLGSLRQVPAASPRFRRLLPAWTRMALQFGWHSHCHGAAGRLRGRSTASNCSSVKCTAEPAWICSGDEPFWPRDPRKVRKNPNRGKIIKTLGGGTGNDVITTGNTGVTISVSGVETLIGGLGTDAITVTSGSIRFQGGTATA